MRVNTAEQEKILDYARSANLSVSKYLRYCALNRIPPRTTQGQMLLLRQNQLLVLACNQLEELAIRDPLTPSDLINFALAEEMLTVLRQILAVRRAGQEEADDE